jgi:hypothetical protein
VGSLSTENVRFVLFALLASLSSTLTLTGCGGGFTQGSPNTTTSDEAVAITNRVRIGENSFDVDYDKGHSTPQTGQSESYEIINDTASTIELPHVDLPNTNRSFIEKFNSCRGAKIPSRMSCRITGTWVATVPQEATP